MRNGWILLLVLICVAFLVSCGKKDEKSIRQGELVRIEAEGEIPLAFFVANHMRKRSGGPFLSGRKLIDHK